MPFTTLAPFAIPWSDYSFPPVSPTTFEVKYNSVFQGLRSKFEQIQGLNFITSGFNLERVNYPYGILFQLSNTFEGRDSQLQRFEHGIYRFSVFDQKIEDIYRLVEELKVDYRWTTFKMNDSFILNELALSNDEIIEVVPGVFRGNISFDVRVQKAPNLTNITTRTTGKNFLNAIVNRADTFGLPQFTTGKWRLPEDEFNFSPIITIGDYKSNESGRTSNTQQMTSKFTINVYAATLDLLESSMFIIDEAFDLGRMVVADKWLLVFEWVSNAITEIVPGIFQGMLNFELVTEEPITPGL